MPTPASTIDDLVNEANQSYERVTAVYFDAKMRTAQMPIVGRLLYVGPPPGGRSPKETLRLVEPLVASRNPEWVRHPDDIPAALKDARRKDSPRVELLSVDPQDVVSDYEAKAVTAGRQIARALGRSDLETALGSDVASRNAAIKELLSEPVVRQASVAEQVAADHAARSAAEEGIDRSGTGTPEAAPDFGPEHYMPDLIARRASFAPEL